MKPSKNIYGEQKKLIVILLAIIVIPICCHAEFSVISTGWVTWYGTNSCHSNDQIRKAKPRTVSLTAVGKPLDESALSYAVPKDLKTAWNMKFGQTLHVEKLHDARTVTVHLSTVRPVRLSHSQGTTIKQTRNQRQ